MTQLALAKRIASIVVYGHLFLFAFGLVVMTISPFNKLDTAQMMLMGSPLLAMIGLAAYRFMGNLPEVDATRTVDASWVRMSTITTSAFIVALFAVYSAAVLDSNISVTMLKLIVGAIETILGGYLGINRDLMFPEDTR